MAWQTDGKRVEQKIITNFDGGAADAKTLVGLEGNYIFIGSDFTRSFRRQWLSPPSHPTIGGT